MSDKRVLMLIGDFVEDYEAMVALQILQMMGHPVATASPGKKSGDKVVTAIHDFEGHQTYTEKIGHNFPITADWSEVRADDFAAVVIPGGRAPEFLQLDPEVLTLLKNFDKAAKPIAAICHGPYVLTAAGLVDGKRCQAYPSLRPELERAGATWVEPSAEMDSVCVDGNLITGPAWPAVGAWMRELLKQLGTTQLP